MYFDNNVDVLWDNDLFKSVVEMTIEHYTPYIKDTAILINTDASDYDEIVQYKQKHPEQKIILYNLEHKYPVISPGKLNCCTDEWCVIFEKFMTLIDEVWDYNIENYGYFESIGYGHIFKFMPLRHTSWFTQFIRNDIPKNYHIEFEGAFDTDMRLACICNLTTPGNYGNMISFKLANTQDQVLKFFEKQNALFCLDIPHYNYPETINALRIFECICLNQPVIIFNPYNIGSRKYFENMVVYVDNLTPGAILQAIDKGAPEGVAGQFASLTHNDPDFDVYKRKILEDFRKISGEDIPDSVL